LKVFLEKEKSLKLEVERLGKSAEQIQIDIDRNRRGLEPMTFFPGCVREKNT
jgi:hypothetical protein